MPKKRTNKSKKEIVSDIKASQEAERMRKLIREDIFPFLLQLNKPIGETKMFLQVASVTLDTAFSGLSKEMKVGDLINKFEHLFSDDTDDNKMYMKFFEKFKDEPLSSFTSILEETPRRIEMFFTQETNKHPVLDIPIDKILG